MVEVVLVFAFLVLVLVVLVVLSWAKAKLAAPRRSERPSIEVMIFFIGCFSLRFDDSRPSCKTIMSTADETTLKVRLK